MDFFSFITHLELWQLVSLAVVALIVGLGKSGLSAATLLAIPILAEAFGAKESTGLMLILYLLGDGFAVKNYNAHVQWDKITKIMPPALLGLLLGAIVGQSMNDQTFKLCLSLLILACLGFMLYQTIKGQNFKVPHKWWFVLPIGILAGFATMIGNASGPIFAIYLLAAGLEKNHFLGTTAWFFLIINLIKLPLQIFAWGNITWQTFFTALIALPLVYIGIKIGVALIKRIQDRTFRYIILIMTALAALRLLFS